MINLKQVALSQEAQTQARYADNRFVGDYETIEFSVSDYDLLVKVDTDHSYDILYETVVGVKYDDMTFYKITAKTEMYNGEKKITFSEQQLTLQGFNFFIKDTEIDELEGIYNNYLNYMGYDFTIEDVATLGEFSTEFNCTILKFRDEGDNDHYITINSKGQLSKITIKQSKRKVNSKSSISSAFGF